MTTVANAVAWLLAPAMLAAMIAVSGPTNLMGDFRAFYCAGTVIAQGADPYREQPLHACEQRADPPRSPAYIPDVTVPAPLPPHALLAFVPLARWPFPLAAALFGLLSIAAMSAAVVLFARATGVRCLWLNLAFAGITATQTYFLGQPTTFALLALAAAAVLLRSGRFAAAAACAVLMSVEPPLALPVLVALLVAVPGTRLPILGFGGLLVGAGIAGLGLPVTIEYVRDVIPAHALANAYEWQFSLTSVLTSLGAGAAVAVRSGEAMYAAMLVLGIVVARRLWRSSGNRAALVLVPPAFCVFGGVHVHLSQLVIAFPAILSVYASYPRLRNLAATGITLAMVPWNVFSATIMTGFTPLVVGWFAGITMGPRRGLVLTAVAMGIALSVLALALAGFGPGEVPFVAQAYPPGALAEVSWSAFSRAALARPSVLMQWLRVPVLVGLALGLTALTRAAFEPAVAA
jgi:hypothetical protein